MGDGTGSPYCARMNLIPPLRWVAVAEATSFLALLMATAIKYSADAPLGVTILGPIHGALFLAYVALAVMVWKPAGWSTATGIAVLVGAVLPFGGFVVDRRDPARRRAGDRVEGGRAEAQPAASSHASKRSSAPVRASRSKCSRA